MRGFGQRRQAFLMDDTFAEIFWKALRQTDFEAAASNLAKGARVLVIGGDAKGTGINTRVMLVWGGADAD